MNTIPTFSKQGGAVLSLEYAILAVVAALSALTIAIWVAYNFPELVNSWYFSISSYATATFTDFSNSICNFSQQGAWAYIGNNASGQLVGPYNLNPDSYNMCLQNGNPTVPWGDTFTLTGAL